VARSSGGLSVLAWFGFAAFGPSARGAPCAAAWPAWPFNSTVLFDRVLILVVLITLALKLIAYSLPPIIDIEQRLLPNLPSVSIEPEMLPTAYVFRIVQTSCLVTSPGSKEHGTAFGAVQRRYYPLYQTPSK